MVRVLIELIQLPISEELMRISCCPAATGTRFIVCPKTFSRVRGWSDRADWSDLSDLSDGADLSDGGGCGA
ncbi:MAG: hypothetical protein IJM74_06535 [Bacteroidales bacterium]|nr:hypothetical protein [Bacteroidales bacterium]